MKVNIADTEHLGENWGWHKCDLLPLEVEFNSMNSQLQKTHKAWLLRTTERLVFDWWVVYTILTKNRGKIELLSLGFLR